MALTASSVPTLRRLARLDFDPVRRQRVLLHPEGTVSLNETGAAILELCDGHRSIATIVHMLVGQDARDALDLVPPSGAIVGLLGPNGAGTTTTMLPFGAAASNACCSCWANLADTREPRVVSVWRTSSAKAPRTTSIRSLKQRRVGHVMRCR